MLPIPVFDGLCKENLNVRERITNWWQTIFRPPNTNQPHDQRSLEFFLTNQIFTNLLYYYEFSELVLQNVIFVKSIKIMVL